MSGKYQVEWFAVAFALTAGCTTTNDPGKAKPDTDAQVDASSSSSEADAGQPDGSSSSNDDDTYVLHVPDGGSQVAQAEPHCGASSFIAEQIETQTAVEVPVEVTENVTEQVTEDVTETVTEDITTEKPTSLYIMFDQSASMGLNNLWNPAVAGLKSFLNDPDSAGLGVGIQYFPASSGTCTGTGGKYATPEVAPASLPSNANTIITSIAKHSPNGNIGTPIQGALLGVTSYCKDFQKARPNEQCIAVLVTDGKPELASGCSENFDTLAAIAKSAKDAGVITFAVGLKGANFTLLDKIAKAGGAPDCDASGTRWACDISSGAEKLNDALALIRETVVTTETHTVTHPVTRTVTYPVTKTVTHIEYQTEYQSTAVPCEWAIPAAKANDFDRNKVNILWTVKNEHTTLLRVDSKEACRNDAWYFDDPQNPTRLIACEQTCSEITASPESNIDILLGCATVVPG